MVDLANHAAANGHRVAILAAHPADPGLLQDRLRRDVEVRFVANPGLSRIARYARMLPWLFRERQWLLDHDIVHAHLTFGSAVATIVGGLRALNRSRRPKLVETYHAVGAPVSRLQRAVMARLALDRDAFVLMADDPYWQDFRSRRARMPVEIIPNGIDLKAEPQGLPERQAFRRPLGIPDESDYVIGTVGRLVKERHPLALLVAFAEADRLLGGRAHFVMGGAGPMLDEARAETERLGLSDRVHFPGLVERPAEIFAILDLYLTLNVGPVTGIAALEAAASGLPLVAVQTIDGREADAGDWIWSSPDPQAVGAEAARLLQDRNALEAIAEGQRSHVMAHHDAGVMASAYEKLYARLLAD